MGRYFRRIGEIFRRGDMVLLIMCLVLNAFGLLMIASTTNQMGPARYLIVQSVAAALGVLTPQPCTPTPAGTWICPGKVRVGGKPVLTNEGKIMCAFAGSISITNPGQQTVRT